MSWPINRLKLKRYPMLKFLPFLILTTSWLLPGQSSAQDRCGTVILQQIQLGNKDYRDDEKKFENWLNKKIQGRNQRLTVSKLNQNEIITIPVVVHVIHNGETLGVGSNIPDGQIISQIETLNQDFRRQNLDASETLVEFIPVAADIEIEFVLAKRDPEGLPTDGIVRVQGSQSNYRILDDKLLKAQSLWPPEDYLNIWVTDLNADLLGYAQFPVSNLEGLTVDRNNNRLTDGVAVDYEFFGTGFNTDPFSQGRTATHEVGHFFGLRHIWGDGGCSRDDFCDDTPLMADNTTGCPDDQTTCGTVDMFQNYMDFTDDNCMNLFTICQGMRMRTVLEESPRRRSLLNSNGGIEPTIVANDLGIRNIISPEVSVCSDAIVPEIEIRNYGSNEINSHTISLNVDGVNAQTLESIVTLAPLATASVFFQPISVKQGDQLSFTFSITEVNGGTDANPENNDLTRLVQVPFQSTFPVSADFESGEDQWMTRNFNGGSSNWALNNAPLDEAANQAFVLDLFNASNETFGNLELILSPVLNLSKVSSAELNFDYAYSPVSGNIIDGLAVAVFTECGVVFDPQNVLQDFEKYGSELATTTMKSTTFVPTGATEWSEATMSLNRFLGMSNVQVALIAQNGGGNNIYVDNIALIAGDQFQLDVKVTEIKALPMISCRTLQTPIIEIKNFGAETINSIDYTYIANNTTFNGGLENIFVAPGESQEIAVAIPDLFQGEFNFEFSVTAINNEPDDDPEDNTLSQGFRITDLEDILPLRERFEQRIFDDLEWFPFSTAGNHNWSFTDLSDNNFNQSLSIQAFNIPEIGTQNWLVSPKLDLSSLTEASLSFDVSYAGRNEVMDQLQVLVSDDCGRTFETIVYDKRGSELAVTSSATEWSPQNSNDWVNEFIDLSRFAGSSDVLVAFVFTNANGNNIYIDNIDFFVSSDRGLTNLGEETIRVFPNPSPEEFNVTFNLEEKESVTINLVDMMGKQINHTSLDNILNQTIVFDATHLRNGLYLIQFIGESFKTSDRVIVMK